MNAQLNMQELVSLLQKKQISCEQILHTCLEKIDKYESQLGAFLSLSQRKNLFSLAKESDKRWQQGTPKSLIDGIPIALKDNIHSKGLATTCGSHILHNYLPPYDATVVEKIKDKGGLILGKTNLDEFAMGSTTETSAIKITKNPWDISRVPGGSSGGSAVAIASQMCPLALGSDTGGSIRQPASFCGVVGIKPTYGLVSRYGLTAYASSLDQIGPMSRDVYGTALLLNIISGFDHRDSTSLEAPKVDYLSNLEVDICSKKIAVFKEISQRVSPAIAKSFTGSLEILRQCGAEISEISFPAFEYAVAAYYLIATAEASSNLARYDGVKYGLRDEQKTYQEMLIATRSKGFGKEVKKRILLGNFVLSSGYYDAYYLKSQKMRSHICQQLHNIFSDFDAIVTPTTPDIAFTIGETKQDFMKAYLADITTVLPNLAGLPAISVPGDKVNELPTGLQIIGKPLGEQDILQIARKFEQQQVIDFTPPLKNIIGEVLEVKSSQISTIVQEKNFLNKLKIVSESYKQPPKLTTRVFCKDLQQHLQQQVTVAGWIHKVHHLGGVEFFILRDHSGMTQLVLEDLHLKIPLETVVEAYGQVVQEQRSPFEEIEIRVTDIKVLGKSREGLPICLSTSPQQLNLPTVLDHRSISVRNPEILQTFKVQADIVRLFGQYLRERNFTEIKTPKIISTGTEGGSNIFEIEYFGKIAYLAQSPQFYKQMMVGSGLERVFEVGPVFRAERHDTIRHLSEYTSLDLEMGFIDNEQEILDMQEGLLRFIFESLREKYHLQINAGNIPKIEFPERIPRVHFLEALEIVNRRGGKDIEGDISPQGERILHEYFVEHYNSHFVYVIGYPMDKRPMYTMPDQRLPGYTRSFDLLYKGIEITTGGQRIHDYQMLYDSIIACGANPDHIKDYLTVFLHGMPPHGGLGMGLERLTMKIMGHNNIRQACLFPRDLNRVTP